MVMAMSNPTQYVAHEFVRQYYTTLHCDPSQLHRFYTKESRFSHSGSPTSKSEDPVCGQEAIYEKIRLLNFRESYARIRSVDSHPTLGGGVVIQVTGELSNCGLPMRKFMQTFVLAKQAPKKYSVFNDIFRYQDEVFDEADNDDANDDSENGILGHDAQHLGQTESAQRVAQEELVNHVLAAQTESVPLNRDNHFGGPFAEDERRKDSVTPESDEAPADHQVHDAGEDDVDETTSEDSDDAEAFESAVPTVNAGSELDDGTEFKEYVPVDLEEAPPSKVDDEMPPLDGDESASYREEPLKSDEPSKPVTWAALAKKNTPTGQATAAKPAVPKAAPVTQTSTPPKKSAPAIAAPPTKPSAAPVQPRKREEPPAKKEAADEPKKRLGPHPDSHQIFIGSLPSNVTESDVRIAFEEFGNIVEIRLNPKNFGFVAFDSPEPPQSILNSQKPIMCQSQPINIEVKRSASTPGVNRGGGFRRDRERGRGGDFGRGGRGGAGGVRGGRGGGSVGGQRARSSETGRSEGSSVPARSDKRDSRPSQAPKEQRNNTQRR